MSIEQLLALINHKDNDSDELYSPTSLVGTIPENVRNFENIFNNKHTINVTITYNQSYADMDTIYEGPTSVKRELAYTGKRGNRQYLGVKHYYFVNEQHANEKRWHMHGQMLIAASCRSQEIDRFKEIYRILSKVGRISMKWNNPEYEVKSEHLTYTRYCFKNNDKVVIEQKFF